MQFVDHILWTFVDEKARTCGHWHYYCALIHHYSTTALLQLSLIHI